MILAQGRRGRGADVDGVAEAWFDDPRAMSELARSQGYAVVREDEQNLVEQSSMTAIITDETVVLDDGVPAEAVKLISFLPKRSDVSAERFRTYWRETRAPIAARAPGCVRYVRCHTRPETMQTDRAPRIDGIEMVWFRDLDSLVAADDSAGRARTLEDQVEFVDVDRLVTVIAREVEIKLRGRSTQLEAES